MRLTDCSAHVIALSGDALPCLVALERRGVPPLVAPSLFVIGIDARGVDTRAALAALLRRHRRGDCVIPSSVAHVIAVIHHDAPPDWVSAKVHRWMLSIHRRMQRSRGVDTDVAALLVDQSVTPALLATRLEELVHRAPGANSASVLTADEIRNQTIAQASTNDFI